MPTLRNYGNERTIESEIGRYRRLINDLVKQSSRVGIAHKLSISTDNRILTKC
jgi:hypothetical protein